jgi:hypothetical protein
VSVEYEFQDMNEISIIKLDKSIRIDFIKLIFCFSEKRYYLCSPISRSGAVVARWAHNPKVVRSNRASATKKSC